jgi:hypothetical protein
MIQEFHLKLSEMDHKKWGMWNGKRGKEKGDGRLETGKWRPEAGEGRPEIRNKKLRTHFLSRNKSQLYSSVLLFGRGRNNEQ